MPKQYNILHTDGSILIPISDATFNTGMLPDGDYANATCWIAFYNADGDIVNPTVGTVTFASMGIHGQWHTGDIINASDVIGPVALYTPTIFSNGPVKEVRVTLSGVDVATHFSAFVWRY